MAPQTKKWTRFWFVFALWLVADLWSKHWADTSLATPNHPLPVVIGEADAGKTLAAVLNERFGWDQAAVAAEVTTMMKLPPPLAAKAEDSPFVQGGVADSAKGLWLFWRGDRSLAPRRIGLSDRRELAKWLQLAVPDAPSEHVNQLAAEAAATKTYASWLPDMFRKVDAEDVPGFFAEGRVHPIPFAEGAFTADTKVASGDTYLVLDHQVPVWGAWWKFIYAENPGAAFGFLKGASPDVRQTLFMLLTIVAFIVIGSIVARLPPTGWLVATAFAGILAGAAGNFIDRVRYGYVIDFIDFQATWENLPHHWPTFNVADIAICIGVALMALDMLSGKKLAPAPLPPAPANPAHDLPPAA